MKKIYSFVLMAAALLIGANSWAVTRQASDAASFEAAWKAAQSGDVIQLTNDVAIDHILYLGGGVSLTLDLNGKLLENKADLKYMFVIEQGDLNVITSQAGGQIAQEHATNEELFHITGSNGTSVDPKEDESGYYSHLTIGEGVFVNAKKKNALVVSQAVNYNGGMSSVAPKTLSGRGWATKDISIPATFAPGHNLANEVRVDVYGTIHGEKYAFKVNGNVEKPANKANSAFVYLHSTSDMNVPATSAADKKPVAVYCSGYARWMIEGHCVGANAVYVKAGDVDIKDAVIESNSTAYEETTGTKSGVTSAGNAIVIESNAAYQGSIEVEISGDTKVTATNGYAITESVTTSDKTKVDALTISGGSFDGGVIPDGQGGEKEVVMSISTETQVAAQDPGQNTTITIVGGQTTQGEAVVGNQSLADFLSGQSSSTHVTYVDNGDGGQTMVISEGAAPEGYATIAAALEDEETSVKLLGSDEISSNVVLDELEMSQKTDQSLTIHAPYKLTVGRVILGAKAQIIVEAGAKFIVTGAQGIVAPVASNILIKAEEGNSAYFLFNPAVKSNRHPNATVEFISKSFRENSSKYFYQRFGIPSFEALSEITAQADLNGDEILENVQTAFASFNGNSWDIIGYLYTAGETMDYSKMAEPFNYYQMLNNNPNPGTKVTMKGQLYGNDNPVLDIKGVRWNGFANSYMAPIDGTQLMDMIPNSVDKAFYLYDITADQASWKSYTLLNINKQGGIQPMQPFLIRNTKAAAAATVDYAAAVWTPMIAKAPARRSAENITKAEFTVKGENSTDYVVVAEDAQFSAEFDNGYDAAKYMNDGINMYVSAAEKMAIYATDNLNNTYVGFQAVEGGNYTIEFTDVQGEDLTLIDLETGARVLMVEGNTYEFTADANSMNDYRFEIVSSKAPTAIENTEAVKSTKGIYTLTGQFVGEMNVWNTLPAGVYVVNGEKRVK